jgi:vacuolar-type H+-ATPase subunit H
VNFDLAVKDATQFMKESHAKEITEARHIVEEEIAEIDGRAQARADSYLQDKIEEFRRVYEIEKNDLRERHGEELRKTLANYVHTDEYTQLILPRLIISSTVISGGFRMPVSNS